MSSATTDAPHQAFGVGSLISESLSIFFSNIIKISVIAFVPAAVGLIISGMLIGFGATLGTADPQLGNAAGAGAFAISTLINMIIYGITIAVLVMFAYDAKMNRVGGVGGYFAPALRHAVPILILVLVITIIATIGFMLLVLPGLWIYAVFCATIPAVVIESAGFGAMGRSSRLTKGYRWPIIGAMILFGIIIIVLSMVAAFGGAMIGGIFGGGFGLVVNLIVTALVSAFSYGLSAIFIALVYARLREMKEGVSVSDLAKVFE